MPPVRPRRAPLAAVLALALAAGAAVAVAPTASAAPPPTPPPVSPAATGELGASARAMATGQPVDVADLRTETQEVTANPDGTFTLRQHTRPVRVRRDGGWVPVDTTLTRRADGTVAPGATSVGLAFSGGGTAPLVRVTRAGGRLDLGWPDALPAPVLDGPTARYVDVRPGVDLVLTADALGFSQVVVVKTAAAAADPALARLAFRTTATGLDLRADAGGNLRAVDAAGTPVLLAPAPEMWDSAGAADPARSDGDRARTVPVQVRSGEVAVVPDRTALTGPGVRYPVAIDPSFYGPGRSAWTAIWKQHPTTSYYNSGDVARVGYETDTEQTVRSLFRFNTSPVAGKRILSATLRTFLEHSWSCSARPVQLYKTTDFGPSTTWSKPPTWISHITTVNVAKGYSSACAPGGVDFGLTAHVANNAAARAATLQLGLKAENEGDTYGWKKFRNNPVLEISYNTPPAAPSGLSTYPNLPCRTGTTRPVIGPSSSTTSMARMVATLADADRNNLRAQFEWYRTNGAKVGEAFAPTPKASGSQFTADIPKTAFPTGGTISWRVRAWDGTDWGAFGPWCELTVDLSRPAARPAVSSPSYPAAPTEPTGGGVGRPGTFTFEPNGVTDVAGYVYQLGSGPERTVPASGTGRTATVQITPPETRQLLQTLSVRSQDAAGNRSDPQAYDFYVRSATPPVGHWRLDEPAGSTVAADETGAHPATFAAGALGVPGRAGSAASMAGGRHAATAGPVLDTAASFSVSAWVKLTSRTGSPDRHQTVVGQAGAGRSAFYLQYAEMTDRWRIILPSNDLPTPAGYWWVNSVKPPTLGIWTHLAGVYDAGERKLRLYVDGVLQGEVAAGPLWTANGPLQIGRVLHSGVVQNPFSGQVDDVRVWDRVVYATADNNLSDELHTLANGPLLAEGAWRLDEGTGTVGADSSGRGRNLGLTGTSWVDGRDDGSAVSLAGTATSYAATSVGGIVRTDQSYTVSAWVKLADRTGDYAAVSQVGGVQSAFVLQYLTGIDRWVLEGYPSDANPTAFYRAVAPEAPELDEWTHLVGIYDAARKELRLCVNGLCAESAVTAYPSAWHATGGIQLGRTRHRGALMNPLRGLVDDVRVWAGAATDDDVLALFVLGDVT